MVTSKRRGDGWTVGLFLLVGMTRAVSSPQLDKSPIQATVSASSAPSRESRSDPGEQTPSGYDHHSSMFAPNGRLLQMEYAMAAVGYGRPILGIRTREGVVLAGRKTLESKRLQDPRFGQKIYLVDKHILVAVTGVIADAIALVRVARSYAQDHRKTYGEPIPVRHLVDRICDVKHLCTMIPRRPFGVSMLFAGWDSIRAYQLYQTEPSANYNSWLAVAVGDGQEALTSALAEKLVPTVGDQGGIGLATSLGAACELACDTLREGCLDEDEAGRARTVEIGLVKQEMCHILGGDNVQSTGPE